jgi:hypothetical protein
MLARRLAGYALVCLAVAFGALHSVAGFVAVGLVMGTLGYFTTSTLEALNTRLTLATGMSSERAARWMQTAMQLGASSGAALGGAMLHQLGVDMFALCLSAVGVATALLAMPLPIAGLAAPARALGQATREKGLLQGGPDARLLKELSLTLGIVGFHIGAFNTLTPVVYQSLNQWAASDFGMASAIAGAGAFAAAVLPRVRLPDYAAAMLVVAMDAALVFAPVPWISILACFGIGFGINHLRIGLRKRLIDLAILPADADQIAAVSAFYYLLMQSAAPLLLSAIVSHRLAGQQAAPWLFVAVACVLLVSLQTLARPMRPPPKATASAE